MTRLLRALCILVGLYNSVPVTIACVLALCWPAAAAAQLFRPPIGIESVFPVSLIRHSVLTELAQIGNGYEIWGEELVRQSHIPIHFTTPVSYPWEYTQKGAASLVKRLQQLSYVRSAQVEYFPSIHPQLLKHYPDLKALAKKERIIRVTLKDWPNADLLSFPTFTVLVFRYVDRSISYSQIVADWKKTIKTFGTLHELRTLLGIEPRLRWQTIPTLTWVYLHYYRTPEFWNRYWSGSNRDVSDRNKQFLRENSLLSFGADDPSNRVRHCYDVSYEYFISDDSWRLFYATGDWFLGWDETIYVSPSSPQMTWIRIDARGIACKRGLT